MSLSIYELQLAARRLAWKSGSSALTGQADFGEELERQMDPEQRAAAASAESAPAPTPTETQRPREERRVSPQGFQHNLRSAYGAPNPLPLGLREGTATAELPIQQQPLIHAASPVTQAQNGGPEDAYRPQGNLVLLLGTPVAEASARATATPHVLIPQMERLDLLA